jgi:putative transposase
MRLNRFGQIVYEEWLHTAALRSYLILDEFVVMPNHFHAVLFLSSESCPIKEELRHFGRPQPQSLGAIIGAFKSAVTRRIGLMRNSETLVWQKRFHEHIIRSESDLQIHREYILNNPYKWQMTS